MGGSSGYEWYGQKGVTVSTPAADGKLYLIGDTTHKPKRGRQHPLGLVTRQSASSPYTFGLNMVVLVASWNGFRIPIALAPVDPKRKGHQNILFRQDAQGLRAPVVGA